MSDLWKKLVDWWNLASPKKRWSTIALFIGILCTFLFLILTSSYKPASITSSNEMNDIDDPLYYFETILKTIGVLVLIVGAAIVLKRMQKKQIGFRSERALSVVESIRLTPKQAMHLVRVGEQYFLVGATDQNLNLISHVEPYPNDKKGNFIPQENRQSFESILNNAENEYQDDSGKNQ